MDTELSNGNENGVAESHSVDEVSVSAPDSDLFLYLDATFLLLWILMGTLKFVVIFSLLPKP